MKSEKEQLIKNIFFLSQSKFFLFFIFTYFLVLQTNEKKILILCLQTNENIKLRKNLKPSLHLFLNN